ncbi:protein kinase domain-containing protein [Parafrankia sp. FMc2]|uniref:protein kinase domain-containing protein n=1 Tax=Parafrankia sp. FMc2 TaxID=3233196 RepID=UPI0034D63A0A
MERPLGSRYVMETLLGRGGMGEVWGGRSTDGEPFAFKLLQPALTREPDVVRRFHDEYQVLETLRSPFVVRVRDLVVEGETIAIVMDLVNGPDLRAYLQSRGTLPPAEAVRLTCEILTGLAAAHELPRQVIHRDLKPENVLLSPEADGTWRAMVTDFGIAKIANRSTSLTGTAAVFGTPRYIAPEIVTRGQRAAAPTADIYSAGVLLYELLCGLTPFADFPQQVALFAPTHSAPGRPDGLPDPLWTVLATMLAQDPASRPATARIAAQYLADLLPSLAGVAALPLLDAPPEPIRLDTAGTTQHLDPSGGRPGPMSPTPPSHQPVHSPPSRMSRTPIIATAALLVLLLAAWGLVTALDGGGDDQGGSTSVELTSQPPADPPASGTPTTSVLTDSPASSVPTDSAATSSPTGSASARPQTGPESRALAGLTPITGGSALTDAREAAVNGETLSNSLIVDTFYVNASIATSIEYNLGRDYVRLQLTLGVGDTSPSGMQCQFEIIADGTQREFQIVSLGETRKVDIDVTDVLRLGLQATAINWDGGTCVFGSAFITPES